MAAPGDKINPVDHILAGLSAPPDPEDHPAEMLCPSDHRAFRFIVRISLAVDGSLEPPSELGVPVYICTKCTVPYRLQECRLIPGEEGVA